MRRSVTLSRRTMLGGSAVLVALPLLEAMVPRSAEAQSNSSPKRLLTYFVPNGMNPADWRPQSTGPNYSPTRLLKPFANVKNKILVLSGLSNMAGKSMGPGEHAGGTAAYLTCRSLLRSGMRLGISMDQVAAQELGKATTIPSMQLGIWDNNIGGCDSGLNCAYINEISWASDTQPLPKIIDPQTVFDQLFAGSNPMATRTMTVQRDKYKKSILDYVLGSAKQLSSSLSRTDQRKLDEYMTAVRDLETRIQNAGPSAGTDTSLSCKQPARPAGSAGLSAPDRINLINDLVVLAFQCDRTRVISYMLGNGLSRESHPWVGVNGEHHEISHHHGDANKLEQVLKITEWEMTQVASLLEKMDKVQENGRTLLDNSLVLLSSDVSDGNTHIHYDMPVLIAGTAGGSFPTGKHISLAPAGQQSNYTMGSLYISMLNTLGVSVNSFGADGQGPLSGLM